MHHKRGKPKSGRAGCLLCKPHKHQGARHDTASLPLVERAARVDERDQVSGVAFEAPADHFDECRCGDEV